MEFFENKAMTEMGIMLKSNGITEADFDEALQKEVARREKLLALICLERSKQKLS